MPSVEESIDIAAPIERVFALVTTPRRAPEWEPHIMEVSEVSGPMGPGASWTQTVSMLGRHERVACRVTRFEPPSDGEVEVTGEHRGRLWTHCERLNGATRLTQGIEFANPTGRLGGIAGAAARSVMKRELHAAMKRLRTTLELEARGDVPPSAGL